MPDATTAADTTKTDAPKPSAKPKIFVFVQTAYGDRDVGCIALAEDGHALASHISSNESWAQHDMGLTSDWKHEEYRKHYPDGFEVEWVHKPMEHAGVMAAYQKNQALRVAVEDAVPVEQPKDWIFTFGHGQRNFPGFVRIHGTRASSREEMVRRYGTAWSMQYGSEEEAGVVRWNLPERHS